MCIVSVKLGVSGGHDVSLVVTVSKYIESLTARTVLYIVIFVSYVVVMTVGITVMSVRVRVEYRCRSARYEYIMRVQVCMLMLGLMFGLTPESGFMYGLTFGTFPGLMFGLVPGL